MDRQPNSSAGAGLKGALWFGLPLVAAASLWQLLVGIGVLDERLTPAPTHILARLADLATAKGDYLLWSNLGASAGRVLPALLIAAVIGTFIGVSSA